MKQRVPKSWSQITLGQFIQLEDLPKTGNAVTNFISKMEVLTDIKGEEIRKMKSMQLNLIVKRLEFLEHMPKPKKIKSFKVNGKTFRTGEVDETTVGQVTDIMQSNETEKNAGQKILNVLSVIYHNEEQGDDYNADRYKQNQESLRDIDVLTAINCSLFFLNGWRSYLPNVLKDSLNRMNMSQMEKLIQETEKELDFKDYEGFINGMISFLDSQEIQSSTLRKHQN
jgi:ribosome-associated protein YbcJ (S4-like RNA binding protein)